MTDRSVIGQGSTDRLVHIDFFVQRKINLLVVLVRYSIWGDDRRVQNRPMIDWFGSTDPWIELFSVQRKKMSENIFFNFADAQFLIALDFNKIIFQKCFESQNQAREIEKT